MQIRPFQRRRQQTVEPKSVKLPPVHRHDQEGPRAVRSRGGKQYREPHSLVRFRLDPDVPVVPFHDTFTQCQANARSGVRFLAVQPLEHPENPISIIGVGPDALVANKDDPRIARSLGQDLHGWRVITAVLDYIVDEIQEHLSRLNGFTIYRRQFFGVDFGIGSLDCDLKIVEIVLQDSVQIDHFERIAFDAPTRASTTRLIVFMTANGSLTSTLGVPFLLFVVTRARLFSDVPASLFASI